MAILVLEASTSAAKAMIYDQEKGALNLITRMYPGNISDVVTIDPEAMIDLVLDVGREAAAGYNIEVIAVNCTWHSLLILDSQMKPKSRIMTWAYREAASIAQSIRDDETLTRSLFHETGCMVHAMYPLYKLIMMQKQGLIQPTDMIVDQGSYLYYRLTGELMASASLVSGTALMNTHSLGWNERSLEMAGVKVNQLPIIRKFAKSDAYAPLSGQAASSLNIRAGIPVGLPYPDGSMNQVGSGALTPGIMTLSVGTSGALRVTSPTPILPQNPGTWCYYAPDRYICGAATNGATNCVDWFKASFTPTMSYKDMDLMVLDADYSHMPTFLPFLFGERCPGWQDARRGGFVGLTGTHRIPELYAAMLEGILFNLYQCYELLRTAAQPPREIRISGGINNSKIWLQMASDLWNQPLRVAKSSQASMMGGAAMGLAAIGIIDEPAEFKGDRGYPSEPNPENAPKIRERYEQYLSYYQGDKG